jgi:hypothetical protein
VTPENGKRKTSQQQEQNVGAHALDYQQVAPPSQTLKICYHPLRSMESAQTDRYRAPNGALSPPIINSIRRWMVVLWGGPSVASVASSGQTLRNCYHPLRSMESAQTDRYRAPKGALSPSIIKSIRRWIDVLWGGPRWLLWLPRAKR